MINQLKNMHIVIGILLGLVGLIVLLLIMGLFLKKEYSLQREIIIHKPKEDVFNYVRFLKNQDYYNKWWMLDPDAKKEYLGIDGTVGFIARWDSNNKQAGKGEQEIKSIREAERLEYEIRFIKPFEGVSHTFIHVETTGDHQTKVIWGFNGKNKYPMNVIFALFKLENTLGNDLQESLKRLKKVLE